MAGDAYIAVGVAVARRTSTLCSCHVGLWVGDNEAVGGDRVDFFISHAGADLAWAEWIDAQLRAAGYTCVLDSREWHVGENFVLAMNDALDRCDQVVALFSEAYFDRSRYTTQEWPVALLHTPKYSRRLIPIRIEDVGRDRIPPLLRPLLYRDLFGLDEPTAREALLAAVAGSGGLDREVSYPGLGSTIRLPGALPVARRLPPRNRGFTGRDGLLLLLRERLLAGDRAVVQALRGMAGVGKTQLAVEYAHRFAGSYEVIWWIDAERSLLIGDQFAALGTALGCVRAETGVEMARTVIFSHLRQHPGWLLIFDNAEEPADIADWLPDAMTGHVLITTRATRWHETVGTPIEIDVFARAESVSLLIDRIDGLSPIDASSLAEQLGDLPQAITQAASYIAESRMPVVEYLALLKTSAAKLLEQGRPTSYPRSLSAAIQLTVGRLRDRNPAAVALAEICAFFAPEPTPLFLFRPAAGHLPHPLADVVTDPIAWRELLADLNRTTLARVDEQSIQLHRLTQSILRDQLPPDRAASCRAIAEAVLVAGGPPDTDDPAYWPAWGRLLPHILMSDPAGSDSADLRDLACKASRYLLQRADTEAAYDLARNLHQHWLQRLGPDNTQTLRAADQLAHALANMEDFTQARHIDENALAIRRRVLGYDHPDTLNSANSLVGDLRGLRDYRAARELDEDTLARSRRVLGDDHPLTLMSASNLASDLQALGDHRAARELDEDTLARRRRILGDDHLQTLMSASNLAGDLQALGDYQAARELDEDTLARRRRILGDDHPNTLNSANNLAVDLQGLGEYQTARQLGEETVTRYRRVLGDDHPDTIRSADNLTAVLRALSKDAI